MTTAFSASEVREFVLAALARLTRKTVEPSALNEVILIGDGVYRGRSYRIGGWMANWLVQAGLVQFYNSRGDLVRTIDLRQADQSERRAA